MAQSNSPIVDLTTWETVVISMLGVLLDSCIHHPIGVVISICSMVLVIFKCVTQYTEWLIKKESLRKLKKENGDES